MQINARQRAIFQRIAGPYFRAFLQQTAQHDFPEISMAHNPAFMLSRISFLMKRKIHRLLGSQPIVGCQSGKHFTGPMAELLFRSTGSIKLGHRAFPNNRAE